MYECDGVNGEHWGTQQKHLGALAYKVSVSVSGCQMLTMHLPESPEPGLFQGSALLHESGTLHHMSS